MRGRKGRDAELARDVTRWRRKKPEMPFQQGKRVSSGRIRKARAQCCGLLGLLTGLCEKLNSAPGAEQKAC